MTHSGRLLSSGRVIVAFATVGLVLALGAAPARADFGLNGFKVSFDAPNGTPATQAGSHPYSMTTSFNFNTTARFNESKKEEIVSDGQAKTIRFDLPAGFAGNPTATPRCSEVDFTAIDTESRNACPNSTVVGIGKVSLTNTQSGDEGSRAPIYNLHPASGVTAKLGFVVAHVPVVVEIGVNGESPNNIEASVINVPQVIPIYGGSVELWGDPPDHAHDPFRGSCLALGSGPELVSNGLCEAGVPEKPFLTLPRSCSGPLTSTYEAVSWQAPHLTPTTGATESPGMTGCSSLGFDPEIGVKPSTQTAESPSGLDFDLDIDDPGLSAVGGTADSDIEKVIVSLPQGITTNPSVASGLQACSESKYHSENVDSEPGTGCPEASKIGTVEVETPLLAKEEAEGGGPEVLHGSLYVAKQHDNPFDNLLTIYMVIKDPSLGIIIKQAGRVEPDQLTGQLTTTFEGLPPLPFSHFHLHFREGQRAPLITPAACGRFTTSSVLYPYDHELGPVSQAAAFEINAGANGDACATSASQLPNRPSFSAGTVDAKAGAYSPFVLRLTRPDGTQQISQISTTLPAGLLGKLAGISYCPEAGIAQAAARSGEGQGAVELASPSCPQGSEVGAVAVTAGAGSEPLYVSGRAYLAGPYKGAPLSLEIITPAIAGPFDLGVVAVRTALQVDPLTAQITAVSDPIPTILHGLPLDVRSIAIDVSRPSFTLNPTSCEPKSITGQATSTLGNVVPLSQYFQAQSCAALKFKPGLKLSLTGGTRRAGHPSLRAVLTYPKGTGYSNIARAQVGLPHSEFLDQGSIGKACTKPVLLASACPAKSIYGRAKAWSPLLEKTLEGPVYLVGGFGYKLPALVAELNGQIRVFLVGKVDTDKAKGIRNTFSVVPDAPVERFELTLKGGPKYGLLENSENLCSKPQKAQTTFVAQNGLRVSGPVTISNECRRKKRAHRAGAGKKHAR